MTYSPTAILIPSLNRPQRLKAVVENIHAVTPEPHRIIFCVGDSVSLRILDGLGETYVNDSLDPDKRYVTRMNKLIHYIGDAQSVFFGSDDVIHHEGWLREALFVLEQAAVVVVNDLHNRNGTQALVRTDYLPYAVFDDKRAAFHSGYEHNFADNEMFFTAQARGAYARALGSVVEHLHPLFGADNAMPWDATYTNAQRGYDADYIRFTRRMGQLQALVEAS